jgi:hypothetical protein
MRTPVIEQRTTSRVRDGGDYRMRCIAGTPERREGSMRALRGHHCRCSACHLEFNSTAAFDKHRIGKHPGRRCRTIPEMRRAGMILSSTGWWITSKSARAHPCVDRRSGDRLQAATLLAHPGPEPILESAATGRDSFYVSMAECGGEAA